MAQPSINRAKGKLDKHSKMQLRIALSILYMQENKTENEKYAKKKKQRPRRCRSPCLAEGIRGRVRSRSAIFYMQENETKNGKSEKKEAETPLAGAPAGLRQSRRPKRRPTGRKRFHSAACPLYICKKKEQNHEKQKGGPFLVAERTGPCTLRGQAGCAK